MIFYSIFVVILYAKCTYFVRKPYRKTSKMKASIKLITSYKPTAAGYPVYLELVDKGKRKREIIGHSQPEFWNFETATPRIEHPTYRSLLTVVLDYKAKIKKIDLENYNFITASRFLFSKYTFKDPVFYDEALKLCSNTKNGILYRSVLNNFNLFYPGIETRNITRAHVKKYMLDLLTDRAANGVHGYLRTLTAIFNKLDTGLVNPFKGIRPKKEKTINKALNDEDLKKLIYTRAIVKKYDRATTDSLNWPRYYWLLMFYLGGIDFVDLAALRYDKHVKNNRIIFKRHKGGSNVIINNAILPQAAEILSYFNCRPYLVPIFKYYDYNKYLNLCNKWLINHTQDLELSKPPLTKAARYSFITRAQQLLIDERITVEIVGHSQHSTHSIYLDQFPDHIRDAAHKKIINL